MASKKKQRKAVKPAVEIDGAKKMGRPRLPDGLKRVRLACTVNKATLDKLSMIAGRTPGSNIGRVLDELTKE